MSQTMKDKSSIDFVARHYRRGAFSVRDGWNRLGLGRSWLRRPLNIAATIAVLIALTTTATVIITRYNHDDEPAAKATGETIVVSATPATTFRPIDVDNAPLSVVLDKIAEVYGIEVENVPENADEIRLTLHFEGNAEDLISTINKLLDTDLAIKQ